MLQKQRNSFHWRRATRILSKFIRCEVHHRISLWVCQKNQDVVFCHRTLIWPCSVNRVVDWFVSRKWCTQNVVVIRIHCRWSEIVIKFCETVRPPIFRALIIISVRIEIVFQYRNWLKSFSAIWNERCAGCLPSCFDTSYRITNSATVLNWKSPKGANSL